MQWNIQPYIQENPKSPNTIRVITRYAAHIGTIISGASHPPDSIWVEQGNDIIQGGG